MPNPYIFVERPAEQQRGQHLVPRYEGQYWLERRAFPGTSEIQTHGKPEVRAHRLTRYLDDSVDTAQDG